MTALQGILVEAASAKFGRFFSGDRALCNKLHLSLITVNWVAFAAALLVKTKYDGNKFDFAELIARSDFRIGDRAIYGLIPLFRLEVVCRRFTEL